jgi:hypothetical protein
MAGDTSRRYPETYAAGDLSGPQAIADGLSSLGNDNKLPALKIWMYRRSTDGAPLAAFGAFLFFAALPMLCIVYKWPEPAKEIFAELRASVTRDDEEELLRISIIEGVSVEDLNAFTVKIGPHIKHVLRHFNAEIRAGEHEDYVSTSRFLRTSPNRPFPLFTEFKEHVKRIGEYKLIPALWINGSLVPFVDLSIGKREIFFRHKSEITPSDEDAGVLREK